MKNSRRLYTDKYPPHVRDTLMSTTQTTLIQPATTLMFLIAAPSFLVLPTQAMSFNTGLSFEIYDLGLGNEGSDEEGDDGDNNSMDGADAEGNGVLIASGDGGGGSIGVDVGVGAEWREPQIVPTLDEFVEHDTIEENDYDGRSGEDDDDERSQFDDISDGDGQHVEYGGY